MLYVVPDTHLGHENIKKYCNRPNNFEKIIEKNWTEIVGENDTAIHLGDISFQEDWIKKLGSWNGRKILIRGNHDKMPQEFYMDCGFTAVLAEMVIDFENVVMIFSHRPKFNQNCDINIHGHQHNLAVYDDTRLYLPLSIEHMGYKPIAIDENFTKSLKKFIGNKKQLTLNEIMSMGQNAIGKPNQKDFYDGFGKEVFLKSKVRLAECYKLLNNPPYNMERYGYRMWRQAIRYIEGKSEKKDFLDALKKFLI